MQKLYQGDFIPPEQGGDEQDPGIVAVIVTEDDLVNTALSNGYKITRRQAHELLRQNGGKISDAFLVDWMDDIWNAICDKIEQVGEAMTEDEREEYAINGYPEDEG